MQKAEVAFSIQGDPDLLVWNVPAEFTPGEVSLQAFALPVQSRPGGFLVAIPTGSLSNFATAAAAMDEEGLLGPSSEFQASLIEEDEEGNTHPVGEACTFLVIDCDDKVLEGFRKYDPVTDSTEAVLPFHDQHTAALPAIGEALDSIREWIEGLAATKLGFYSAREEPEESPKPKPAMPKKTTTAKRITTSALAEQVAALAEHMKLLATQQEEILRSQNQPPAKSSQHAEVASGLLGGSSKRPGMPAVSTSLPMPGPGGVPKAAKLVGPPPKTKTAATVEEVLQLPAGEEPADPLNPDQGSPTSVALALTQQSAAITALVAHLTTRDAMTELSSSSSAGPGLNTRGVARREKMQMDLSARTSTYFLQVQQQLFRRMNPTKPIPSSETELAASGVSMTAYLERYGGYKGNREAGLVLWILAHAMDALAAQDVYGAREYLALLTASLEQSAMDSSWNLAYVLCLLEDPPNNLFADRMIPIASGRPFAPLVPPSWSATALSYLKEVDLLASKKQEIKTPKSAPPKAAPGDPENPKPKGRPRFPKKPKGGGEEA